MISKFKWASFPLKTALDTNLEEQANIAYTESNVQQFLARLEENMAFLVQNIAKNKQKLSQQEAVFANLRLEELNKKTWEQPQSAVQYKEEINELSKLLDPKYKEIQQKHRYKHKKEQELNLLSEEEEDNVMSQKDMEFKSREIVYKKKHFE